MIEREREEKKRQTERKRDIQTVLREIKRKKDKLCNLNLFKRQRIDFVRILLLLVFHLNIGRRNYIGV